MSNFWGAVQFLERVFLPKALHCLFLGYDGCIPDEKEKMKSFIRYYSYIYEPKEVGS